MKEICLHEVKDWTLRHNGQTNLIGWSETNTYYIDENLTNFRLWDFSSDCQIHWSGEDGEIANYPTGRNEDIAALYANDEFDWSSSLLVPSIPDFDMEAIDAENSQIEKLFRQFVPVILNPDDIILDFDNGELNLTEYAGTFECVFQCKINNNLLELAIVSKNTCFCIGYETIDVALEVVDHDSNLEPEDYVSVFHLDPEAGHNFGYKFWQAVNYPTFFHLFEDWFNIVSEIPHDRMSTKTPSKCLEFCKNQDFEIAILHHNNSIDTNNTDNFDCLCLYSQFIKFTLQDLASDSIQKYYKYWCPDLDGPCTQDDSNLKSNFFQNQQQHHY